jgi:hypothetical protein
LAEELFRASKSERITPASLHCDWLLFSSVHELKLITHNVVQCSLYDVQEGSV